MCALLPDQFKWDPNLQEIISVQDVKLSFTLQQKSFTTWTKLNLKINL